MLYIFALVLSVPSAVLRGYVLATLWTWFVLNAFPGVPRLSIVNAIGISYIVSMLTLHRASDDDDDTAGAGLLSGVVFSVMLSLLSLGFGWVAVQFQ